MAESSADGKVEFQGSYTKVIGSTQEADIDAQAICCLVELTCGCYWSDVDVVGVCAECTSEGTGPNVCKAHFVVCDCGAPCCWKHSYASEEPTTRVCSRCHLREKYKAFRVWLLDSLGWITRLIFVKSK